MQWSMGGRRALAGQGVLNHSTNFDCIVTGDPWRRIACAGASPAPPTAHTPVLTPAMAARACTVCWLLCGCDHSRWVGCQPNSNLLHFVGGAGPALALRQHQQLPLSVVVARRWPRRKTHTTLLPSAWLAAPPLAHRIHQDTRSTMSLAGMLGCSCRAAMTHTWALHAAALQQPLGSRDLAASHRDKGTA